MQDFLNQNVLVGVTGGIAAYKTAYLVRELVRLGANVRVVMTESAQEFITPMTLQALSGNDVRCDLFDSNAERAMGHIELARWADYLVVAPASANCLAKMANGLSDDLLSTLYLVAEVPVIICPAMNRSMWSHPATQNNIKTLTTYGVIVVGPEEGSQACGEYGLGRLSEADTIIDALRLYEVHQKLRGKRLLLTAGPTVEKIDPVRFISNRSSGKMGYALAQAALMAGAEVTLISGPTQLTPPRGLKFIAVETAQEMYDSVFENLVADIVFISTAAVADFTVIQPSLEKIKRQGKLGMTVELTANPDILSSVVESQKASYTVGFAAETDSVLTNAQKKLQTKNVNMIIANKVGRGEGFDVDVNQVTVLTNDTQTVLPMAHKTRLAAQIIAILAQKLQN